MKFDITFNGVPLTDFGGRYRINRHSSLDGYLDFLRSGGMPSRRTEALVRKAEAKRHKKFNAYARKRGHFIKTERPKMACPVCGRVRRTGYYNACPDCYPILGFRRRLAPFLKELGDVLERQYGSLSYTFHGYLARLRLEVRVTLHSYDAALPASASGFLEKVKLVGSMLELDLDKLMRMDDRTAAKAVSDDVARMWEATLRKVRDYRDSSADDRGNSMEVCGVPIPAAGDWRMRQ